MGGWREGEGTISSSLCLRVPHLLEPTRVRICALTAGGGPGQGARVAAAPRGSLKLFLPPVPQPIAEQDCVRHICLQGELIRVNQSQHCPQGAAPPRCGVLGLAVRVGGDHCCPIWECACESWGLPAPPVSPSYPYPSPTSAPHLCALGSRGNFDMNPQKDLSPGRFPTPVTFDLCGTLQPAPRASGSLRKRPGGPEWPWPWGHLFILLVSPLPRPVLNFP